MHGWCDLESCRSMPASHQLCFVNTFLPSMKQQAPIFVSGWVGYNHLDKGCARVTEGAILCA